MDELLEADPFVFAMTHLDRFEMMLLDQDDRAAAYEYANKLLKENTDDPLLLARLAEKIATDPVIPAEKRDFDAAKALAKAAAAGVSPEDPYRYHIEAVVYYHAGEFRKAVSLQRQAWRVAHPVLKPRMQHHLEIYTKAMREGRAARVP